MYTHAESDVNVVLFNSTADTEYKIINALNYLETLAVDNGWASLVIIRQGNRIPSLGKQIEC